VFSSYLTFIPSCPSVIPLNFSTPLFKGMKKKGTALAKVKGMTLKIN